jgi:hypothetical protein
MVPRLPGNSFVALIALGQQPQRTSKIAQRSSPFSITKPSPTLNRAQRRLHVRRGNHGTSAGGTRVKASHLVRRQANLYAKKCTTFAGGNMERGRQSRRSRSGSQRPGRAGVKLRAPKAATSSSQVRRKAQQDLKKRKSKEQSSPFANPLASYSKAL